MAVAPAWRYILTTRAGVALGEVQGPASRQLIQTLSAPASASFTVPVSHTHREDLLNGVLNLQVWRDGVLMFHGPVITTEMTTADATLQPMIAVTAADPSWYFAHRVAGKSSTGTVFTGTDRLTNAEALITTANSENDMGLNVSGLTCGFTHTYTAGPYKMLSECLVEMGQSVEGFDWVVDPIPYASGKIGNWRAAATIGTTRTAAVFDYAGGRKNMRIPSYTRTIDGVANYAYHVLSATNVLSKTDATSISTYGRMETLVEADGLTATADRNLLLDEHILVRKSPRKIISFSPDYDDYTGRLPRYGTDYALGDLIRARILYEGTSLIDGFVRLYRMQFDIDSNNREVLTPTLVDEA